MTVTPLFIASAAAFLSAVLLVFVARAIVGAMLECYADDWAVAQRRNAGKMAAIVAFLKTVLVAEAQRFDSVKRIYAQLERDVARANAPTTAEDYLAQSLLEGFAVAVVGGVLCALLLGPFSVLIPALMGYAWALWVRPSLVGSDGEKRSRSIYRGIPYALDLGVLVLQAGGTLREVLDQVSKGGGAFAEELRIVIKEMDSGSSQATALRNMSARVRLDVLETIVLAINRGEETGAPMAETLTTQAQMFRQRRLQELEKLAVEAPTKMTFPNMMVMLSVLVIIIGPLLMRISTSGMF